MESLSKAVVGERFGRPIVSHPGCMIHPVITKSKDCAKERTSKADFQYHKGLVGKIYGQNLDFINLSMNEIVGCASVSFQDVGISVRTESCWMSSARRAAWTAGSPKVRQRMLRKSF